MRWVQRASRSWDTAQTQCAVDPRHFFEPLSCPPHSGTQLVALLDIGLLDCFGFRGAWAEYNFSSVASNTVQILPGLTLAPFHLSFVGAFIAVFKLMACIMPSRESLLYVYDLACLFC